MSIFGSLWYLFAHTLASIPLHFKGYCELIVQCCPNCLLWLHPALYLLSLLIYFEIPLNIRILVYEFFSYCDVNILGIRSKSFEALQLIIFIILILLRFIIILYSIRNYLICIIRRKRLSPHSAEFVFEKHLVSHLILGSRVP